LSLNRWLDDLVALESDAVLVTVLQTRGSVPREAGTKMLVSSDDIRGTIGGGHLEYQCISLATERLAQDDLQGWAREIRHFPLGARLGQCCGGVVVVMLEYVAQQSCTTGSWSIQLHKASVKKEEVVLVTPLNQSQDKFLVTQAQSSFELFPEQIRDDCQSITAKLLGADGKECRLLYKLTKNTDTPNYFFERIAPSRFHIMLFGAGHVGRALVKTLEAIDCQISWVDNREDQFPDSIPANTTRVISDYPEDEVSSAPADTSFVIMTHDHQLDQRLCEAVLERNDIVFCGLIGSNTKKHKFEHRLKAKGFSEAKLGKLTCPIGLPSISGKEPATIAVSVAAQLLALNPANN